MVNVPKNLRAGLVSIGLPVYNGGRYLRAALDSLIAQDYPDFEIIISDNASDDETETICHDYAARDARIRYSRAERNMGPVWNTLQVYEAARGEYFLLAAHDDLRHPQYLSRCVAELRRHPEALFCCTGVRFIDANGDDISEGLPLQTFRPVGPTPRDRLQALARSSYWYDIYSLIRTPAIAESTLGRLVWGGDVLMVASLCLAGEVAEVKEPLFIYRLLYDKTPQDTVTSINSSGRVPVSWIHLTLEVLLLIGRAPLNLGERLSCAWTFFVEFCIRNQVVSGYIADEGFSGVRHAIAWGDYRKALVLTMLAVVLSPFTYTRRLRVSARYRLGRLKSMLRGREYATPRTK